MDYTTSLEICITFNTFCLIKFYVTFQTSCFETKFVIRYLLFSMLKGFNTFGLIAFYIHLSSTLFKITAFYISTLLQIITVWFL